MSFDPASISMPGAVPLGRPAPASPTAAGPNVVDVTEATFATEVLERSRTTPVVLDFWASWCGPCKQLSPILEKVAAEGGGSWVLAKIDCDANPRLAQAAAVQGIPAVKAVVGEQVVGEFTGALPEPQVRQWIDSLLAAVSGAAPPDVAEPAAADADAGPAELAEAADALRRGDLDGAAAAYQRLADREPGSADARVGLARVGLLRRITGIDDAAARAAAEQRPDDVAASVPVADLDMAAGEVDAAFDRLLGFVRRGGDERDVARTALVSLFDVLDPDDPRLAAGRRALSNALY